MNEFDKAIVDYNEAIRLDPKFLSAYLNRADAWSRQQKFDNAAADIKEAMRLYPNSVLCYLARGCLNFAQGCFSAAIADYDEALRLDPKLDAARYWREVTLDRQQANNVKAPPVESKDQTSIAETIRNAQKERFTKVDILQVFDKTVREAPESSWARLNRGVALSQAREYDKAIADYEKAIELDPSNAIALDRLARLRATCAVAKYRDGAKAVEAAKKACELNDWNDPLSLDTLAAACAETGDFAAALKWETKAVELASDPKIKKECESRLALYQDNKALRMP